MGVFASFETRVTNSRQGSGIMENGSESVVGGKSYKLAPEQGIMENG